MAQASESEHTASSPAPATESNGAKAVGEERDAEGTTELLLNALAGPSHTQRVSGSSKSWTVPSRQASEGSNFMSPESFLGQWVDSQGNMIQVTSTDAYEVRLQATLSHPPRADIHLLVKPVMLGGGWQCGHSVLDPHWSSQAQLHWVTADGRVSVWIRPMERAGNAQDDSQPAVQGSQVAEAP
uniref:Uncharacterized protein n=1 Tax=Noctiluca scintillans TaxID=2966 RepID=A0A7S1AMQ3_NOCSC|mmetsp:Transcript_52724/g.140664  ORF Transcript_52724/g.140664 Transcript_52724/m.140664 type:complete len:184 (+) Transcript_52724:74-625(+)|eukprot:CAMPEP_0194482102 /NCGR_PEP_ID=MMETSP0253-20130528/4209_1 /TAXON_ID=2966 /ORGANISM="Noctiluca scintillans" /LENGTH=183 /DNA_ID=CAMNT_0039321619 /DNA_START=73 /DNA_END=624 /DNA_ORIENTATION=+